MKSEISVKSAALWLDHAEAKLILPGKNIELLQSFKSPVETHERIGGESSDVEEVGHYITTNHEYAKHERRQNQLHTYYEILAKRLLPFDEILIFGPTTAGEELYNLLLADKHFAGKRIHIKKEDYMTENQLMRYAEENLGS